MAFTTFDNAPYLYRRSGGGGDKEIDKLVGGTIAWNQLFKSGADGVNPNVGTKTYDSTTNTFTVTNSTAAARCGIYTLRANVLSTPNHKYLIFVKATNTVATNLMFGTDTSYKVQSGFTANTEKVCAAVINPTNSASFIFYFNNASSVKFRDIQIFDLTLMFGSTIADYVYSLEQSSQGSGLAWLRSYGFFTEDYYDYNSGELKSVSNLVSHDMTGKNYLQNLASSQTTNGITYTVNSDGSFSARGTATARANLFLRTVSNPQRLPQGNYILSQGNVFGAGEAFLELAIRRADGTTQYVNLNARDNFAFTLNEGDYIYQPYFSVYSGTTIDATIYPMVRLASVTDDTYEPYTLHSYPLGNVTLRGLPKLNGNALYYGGDTYESNGTVTRKYGIVDLGSLTWTKDENLFRFYAYINGAKAVLDNADVFSGVSSAFTSMSSEAMWADHTKDGVMALSTGANLSVRKLSLMSSTTADFKTAMSGVYLVYELATPTTETADTYTNPQWVDPNGTERYTLFSNAFPMPVGHETTYNTDMGSKTVNTQVNLSMTEPQVRQIYAKEGDTARVLNIHLDQTEEDGTLRILRPDGTEVTTDAVLVPEFYDGLMAEIPSDATSVVGKCYCDVEQNGVSSMPFTLNVKKNERES